MIKTFKEYFKEVTESKDESRTPRPVYLQFKVPESVAEYYHKGVDISTANDVEDDPHVTLFYATDVIGLTDDEVIATLQPILANHTFNVALTDYSIFEGVSDGTADCLKVDVLVTDELRALQNTIKITLEEKGAEVKQDFPEWKPHFTIAYYPKGEVPNTRDKYPRRVEVTQFYCELSNDGNKIAF